MKNNRSLAISNSFNKFKMSDYLGVLQKVFPMESIENRELELRKKESKAFRQRVFSNKDTLQIMVMASIQEDKSLQNAVDIFYTMHQRQKQQLLAQLKSTYEVEKQKEKSRQRKPGRPRNYSLKLPLSLDKDISLNTAAFSKARGRVPIELIETLFKESKIDQLNNVYSHWRGYRVLIADGTYLQLQDTPEIRKEYEVKHNGVGSEGYPQSLLETLTERGSGQIYWPMIFTTASRFLPNANVRK